MLAPIVSPFTTTKHLFEQLYMEIINQSMALSVDFIRVCKSICELSSHMRRIVFPVLYYTRRSSSTTRSIAASTKYLFIYGPFYSKRKLYSLLDGASARGLCDLLQSFLKWIAPIPECSLTDRLPWNENRRAQESKPLFENSDVATRQ